jgi:integrase
MTTQALIPEESREAWEECSRHFLRHCFHHSESTGTAITYRNTLALFFGTIDKDPSRVTGTDVENFLSKPVTIGRRRGLLIGANTRNTRRAIIGSFYNFAAGFIPTGSDEPLFAKINPVKNVSRSQPVVNYRAMDVAEIEAFFSVIPETCQGLRDKALFTCYLFTSRRISELQRLTWGDLQEGLVTEKTGKTRQGVTFRYRQKGRGLTYERAELPRICYDAICDYLRAAGRLETIRPADNLWLAVGPPQGGGKPRTGEALNTRTIRHAMKKYLAAAGLDVARISVHSWRHTCVQLRLANGDSLLDIMAITGHRSFDAFYTYARTLQSSADEGAAKLEARLPFLANK